MLGAGGGGSVAGNCFKIITETWQAGALPVRVQVSARGAHTLPLSVFLPWPGSVWCGLGSGLPGRCHYRDRHVCPLHHRALGSQARLELVVEEQDGRAQLCSQEGRENPRARERDGAKHDDSPLTQAC